MPYQPPKFGIRTLANMAGCIVAIPLLPVFLVVKLVMMPFEKPSNLSPEQVVDYLKGFLEGTDGPWDWDDFTTIPIADPRLDDIRDRVAALDVPLSDADIGLLKALLAEAEAIVAADQVDFDQ